MPDSHGSHIALLVADLHGRGVQRVTLNLVQELHRKGFNCDLVLTRGEGELLKYVPSNVRIINLGASGAIKALPALIGYLRREKPEAMISAEDNTNVVALLARRLAGYPKKLTVSSHVSPGLWATNGAIWHKRYWLRHAVRLTYPMATARIAISRGMADEIASLMPLSRDTISVIYNPVVTPEFLAQANVASPHHWFAAGAQPVILGIGSLTPIKGFDILLQAFAELRKTTEVRLMILGKGPQINRLQQLAIDLGVANHVFFTGFVSNPAAYLAHAKLFVLSSRSEGLPTVLIEAMACGCPVVSTECSRGASEILEEGRWGPLVAVDDAMELTEAMQATLFKPPDPQHLKARSMDFLVDRVTDSYLDLLGFHTE